MQILKKDEILIRVHFIFVPLKRLEMAMNATISKLKAESSLFLFSLLKLLTNNDIDVSDLSVK